MKVKNPSDSIRGLAAWAALSLLAACAGPATLTHQGFAPSDGGFSRGRTTATFHGCPVFTANSYYNRVITAAAADPNSANYISSVIQAGDGFGFDASTGVERVNIATDSTPLLKVLPLVNYNHFPLPYPWASNFFIEPLGDRHAIIVQTQTCHLYESYLTTYVAGILSARSGANWNLKIGFTPVGAGKASAMASGLSLFAGMVRWEDYRSGAIRHALNWDGIAHTLSQYRYVRPASTTGRCRFTATALTSCPTALICGCGRTSTPPDGVRRRVWS